jgi:hypothetical protein
MHYLGDSNGRRFLKVMSSLGDDAERMELPLPHNNMCRDNHDTERYGPLFDEQTHTYTRFRTPTPPEPALAATPILRLMDQGVAWQSMDAATVRQFMLDHPSPPPQIGVLADLAWEVTFTSFEHDTSTCGAKSFAHHVHHLISVVEEEFIVRHNATLVVRTHNAFFDDIFYVQRYRAYTRARYRLYHGEIRRHLQQRHLPAHLLRYWDVAALVSVDAAPRTICVEAAHLSLRHTRDFDVQTFFNILCNPQ